MSDVAGTADNTGEKSVVVSTKVPHIGEVVHIYAQDPAGNGNCSFAQVAVYEEPRNADSWVSVIGISDRGIFTVPQVHHLATPVTSKLVVFSALGSRPTWHWPEECPWHK